jgi:hypothetical protein
VFKKVPIAYYHFSHGNTDRDGKDQPILVATHIREWLRINVENTWRDSQILGLEGKANSDSFINRKGNISTNTESSYEKKINIFRNRDRYLDFIP